MHRECGRGSTNIRDFPLFVRQWTSALAPRFCLRSRLDLGSLHRKLGVIHYLYRDMYVPVLHMQGAFDTLFAHRYGRSGTCAYPTRTWCTYVRNGAGSCIHTLAVVLGFGLYLTAQKCQRGVNNQKYMRSTIWQRVGGVLFLILS